MKKDLLTALLIISNIFFLIFSIDQLAHVTHDKSALFYMFIMSTCIFNALISFHKMFALLNDRRASTYAS